MRFNALLSKTAELLSKGALALALVLSGAYALAALSSCAGREPSRTGASARIYRDPSGDAISSNMRLDRKSKPDVLKWVDVRAVEVSSDGNQLITFAIVIPGAHGFGADIAVPNTNSLLGAVNITVSIRSDSVKSEGSATSWAIGYDIGEGSSTPGHVFLEKPANPGSRTAAAQNSVSASFENGVAALTVNGADLGIPTKFDFAVTASVGSGVVRTDRAPNKGWWSY